MLNNTPSVASRGFTTNRYVNAILWDGNRLPRNTITYSFINSNGYRWVPNGREVIESALDEWESVANIEFVRVSDNNTSADFKLNLEDNAYFNGDGEGVPGSVALGRFSAPGLPDQGTGFFNVEELDGRNIGLEPGEVGYKTIVHEIGHGLGLGHPHDTSANLSTTFPGIRNGDARNVGPGALNQGVWTTMSYNNGFNNRGFESSPMAFDIAAVQHLYGANPDHARGNNTYMLSDLDSYTAIWDTGGTDTISGIRLGTGVNAQIDLRDAPLTGVNAGGYISSAARSNAGFTIANRVKIENAQGSLSDDRLVGNRSNNILRGEAGRDRLIGLEGSDNLSGGSGDDTLIGTNSSVANSGFLEYDRLYGGDGRDLFILGDRAKAYYQSTGYATIADFDRLEGDKILVSGSLRDYSFANSQGGTDIFYREDRIGYVADVTNISTFDFEFA